MDKLKCKCSKCGREFSVDLPDDPILRQFSVTCKDCVKLESKGVNNV